MSTVINKSAPSFGGAIGYFIITAYAIPNGYLDPNFVAEGVVMAGIICTNIIMELRAFIAWTGAFFIRDRKE
jgi:hypothetical protein